MEILKKFAPQNFNDFLALGALIIIPGMWVFQALAAKSLPGEVNGALIATFTLIIQYYFRRKPSET
jgi:hypothetical protein